MKNIWLNLILILVVNTVFSVWPPENLNRGLIAFAKDKGKIYLGWRLLEGDDPQVGFNVFRSLKAGGPYQGPLNPRPITTSTNYLDRQTKVGSTYYYIVKTTAGSQSNETSLTALENGEDWKYFPLQQKQKQSRIWRAEAGDLTGDGMLDLVLMVCTEADIYLQAYNGENGQFLWNTFLSPMDDLPGGRAPYAVWDMDRDGKCEVYIITDHPKTHENILFSLNGQTGKEIKKIIWPWPDGRETGDGQFIGIGLWQKQPHVVVLQNTGYDRDRVGSFSGNLEKEWETYFAEGDMAAGSIGHTFSIFDGDEDGNDEILWGTKLINSDGTLRWNCTAYPHSHVDISEIGDFDPTRPGPEVYFADCAVIYGAWKNKAEVYLVDFFDGRYIWNTNWDPFNKRPFAHLHGGVVGDVHPAPGLEIITWDDYINSLPSIYPKDQYPIPKKPCSNFVMDVKGNFIKYGTDPLAGCGMIQFDSDSLFELVEESESRKYLRIFNLDGDNIFYRTGMEVLDQPTSIDLFGDYREEHIAAAGDSAGIYIVSSTTPVNRRQKTWLQDRAYRQGITTLSSNYTNTIRPGGYPFGDHYLNQKPQAVIQTKQTKVGKNEQIQLSGGKSSDPDQNSLTYFWEFGDGQTSNEKNPRHAFSKAGTYKIQLRVGDR